MQEQAEEVVTRAKEIQQVKVEDLTLHPKNPNKHSKEQIERLATIVKYQGFRSPLIVSNRSGLLISGHGRIEVAKKLGMKTVPVIYQDFENEDQEYAALVSENAIASWAELDLSGINTDIGDLGPDFDISLLGLKDFLVEPFDREEMEIKEKELDENIPTDKECPSCGYKW